MNKKSNFLYTLTTSLFYPAVLGALIYFFLEDLSSLILDSQRIIYMVASMGIVVSFSIDFIYSVASKAFYSLGLFVSDCAVLILLFISYKNLMDGLKRSTNIRTFFIGFCLINIIFFVWDYAVTKRYVKNHRIIIFDLSGLLLSSIGLIFFYEIAAQGVIFLWIYTIGYIIIGITDISKLVEKE